jgi:hypothetical protein
MKSIIIGVLCLLIGAVGVALAARIDGGQSTLSWEIEPGGTRIPQASITDGGTVGASGRIVQHVRVCVANTNRCREREIVCTSGTTATLDGVAIGALPTALAMFCDAGLGGTTNFVTRRNAVMNAAGVKTLLVGP